MCNYITKLARMLEVSSLVIERAHTLYKFFVTRRTREKKPMLPIHHKQIAMLAVYEACRMELHNRTVSRLVSHVGTGGA